MERIAEKPEHAKFWGEQAKYPASGFAGKQVGLGMYHDKRRARRCGFIAEQV